MFSYSGLIFVGTVLLCFWSVTGQVSERDVDDELKFLFQGDLDTWKPPSELLQRFPAYLGGYDHDNRPVWIVEFGKWDVREYVNRGAAEEQTLEKYLDRYVYTILKSLGDRATPEDPVKEAVEVIDMDGYGLSQISSPQAVALVLRSLRRLLQVTNYLADIYMVNCNPVAHNFVQLIKPILGKQGEKLFTLGTNKEKWAPTLLRNIPKEALPEKLGGVKDFMPLKVVG